MVKFCDKCGAELKNDNVKFCDKCGAEVKANNNNSNAGTTVGGVVICPHCGQTTPMGQTICAKCGSSLENNTTAVIVGYIVTLILGFFGIIPGIYLLTRNNGKAKTQGLILTIISILWVVVALVFQSWVTYILIILLIIGGAIIWFTDTIIIN